MAIQRAFPKFHVPLFFKGILSPSLEQVLGRRGIGSVSVAAVPMGKKRLMRASCLLEGGSSLDHVVPHCMARHTYYCGACRVSLLHAQRQSCRWYLLKSIESLNAMRMRKRFLLLCATPAFRDL